MKSDDVCCPMVDEKTKVSDDVMFWENFDDRRTRTINGWKRDNRMTIVIHSNGIILRSLALLYLTVKERGRHWWQRDGGEEQGQGW